MNINNSDNIKAVVLFSGGLDSILSAKIIQLQGIKVIGLHFLIPFSTSEKVNSIVQIAEEVGIPVEVVCLEEEFIEIVKNPKFGYGKNLNPCVDCRIFMLIKAKEFMRKKGAHFIITGEVVGQRPKSQHKRMLIKIEKEAGMERLIVRPLSAKLLPLTYPEEKGWIKRENLFAFQGRTRKPQLQLAHTLGIKKYLTPASGCLLTEPSFCYRLKDLLIHNDKVDINEIKLLRIGRHFRLRDNFRLIVGRNEKENNKLLRLSRWGDVYFEPKCIPGPAGLGRGMFDEEILKLASTIVGSYSSSDVTQVEIKVKIIPSSESIIVTKREKKEKFKMFMVTQNMV